MAMLAQRYDPAFPIGDLFEHPDNPRRGDEAAIEDSMNAHGFYGAVLVQSSSRRIIAGNHRTRVARRLGEETIPVLFVDVDDDQARRLLLVDNRSNDQATYDHRELARVLEELAATEGALIGTGFDEADLAELLKHWGRPGDPDTVPATPVVARSEVGDLWILGKHRLLCGDCTKADDVDRVLADVTPRLMVTDPPYLVDYTGGNHPQSHHNQAFVKEKFWDTYHEGDASSDLYNQFMALAVAHLDPAAPVYQWHADRRASLVDAAWAANGVLWHQTLYWVKNMPILTHSDFMWGTENCAYGWQQKHRPPARRRPPANQANVWQIGTDVANPLGGNKDHPTIKPVQLYTDPYTWHLRAGEWAYEPFSGSGTAIAAAEVTGRRCAAIEIEPVYVDVACARWQQITGELPVLEATGETVDFGHLEVNASRHTGV